MKKTILLFASATFLAVSVSAVETTGREFSELIREMDSELTNAKNTVEKLEAKRGNKNIEIQKNALTERGQALRKLEEYTNKLDDASDPEEKKEASKKVEEQVLKVSKLSADFLEAQKNDLVTQDKQLEVVENALSSVIIKMDKLNRLASKSLDDKGESVSADEAKLKARKSLKKIANVVEMLSTKTGKSMHWRSVRATIALHNQMLKNTSTNNSEVLKMLKTQKQIYEQVLAQIAIVRSGLMAEKELLGQIALGEVARSLLRKAAGLLLGNQNIEELGRTALLKSEQRQQKILAFMRQDKENSSDYNSLNEDFSADYPSGYADFLNEEVK
jgi:hypothetical protein